jgi:hypothetical protein
LQHNLGDQVITFITGRGDNTLKIVLAWRALSTPTPASVFHEYRAAPSPADGAEPMGLEQWQQFSFRSHIILLKSFDRQKTWSLVLIPIRFFFCSFSGIL